MELLTLYRPTGPNELALIEASGWRQFPPRLPEQPIFYPETNFEYLTEIARDCNDHDGGTGFLTRFQIRLKFGERYSVGMSGHAILLVPADELPEFNANIVGLSEVIAEFR